MTDGWRSAAIVLCVGALAACPERRPDGVDERVRDPERAWARVSRLEPRGWDGRTGAPLDGAALAARLAAADVVLVGEEHGDPDFQLAQLQVALTAPFDVIAFEWLPRARRPEVQAWQSGAEPVAALAQAVDWAKSWGHDFRVYAPIFAFARDRGVALEPINAPRELARQLARAGLAGVAAELRSQLTPLDSGSDAHRAWFAEKMTAAAGGHGHGHPPLAGDALERYYLAQLLWDETMARATRALAAGRRRVLVLAGLGHVERALGIPARLGDLRFLVVRPVKDAAEAQTRARDADYPEREADLLWAWPR